MMLCDSTHAAVAQNLTSMSAKIIINDLNQTNPGIDAYGSAKNLDVCLEMPAVEHVAPCFSEGSLL